MRVSTWRAHALLFITATFVALTPLLAQETLSLLPDSPRWLLEGEARPAEYLGRSAIQINGGGASIKEFELRDGVVDVDVATPAARGFFGIQFRIDGEGRNGEWVYLRQHKSGLPDAMQYTPILNTGLNWQLYNGPGFTGAVDIPRDRWFHLRLQITGAQAALFVDDMSKPILVMPDLKSGIRKGSVALAVLTGETYFSNFSVTSTADSPWKRNEPAIPPGTITKWSISPAFDALGRDPEKALTAAEVAGMTWQEVTAEAPGLVNVNRYRDSPHPRVTFQRDFSTRLQPQPGSQIVYAKAIIRSERDEVKKLAFGYSDEVSVFLNGRILYRGRSAQSFRDPGFLGIVSAENDAVYLPLKSGSNELILALTELGGGWGFVCRVER